MQTAQRSLNTNLLLTGAWIGLALLILFAPLTVRPTMPAERVFQVNASQFAYSPATLHVNTGDHVTIKLSATDVMHGLAIDGYGLSTRAEPGQPATLSFNADRSGMYRFRCTVTCGNMHPFMQGKIVVGPNLLFWRAGALALMAAIAFWWVNS